MKINLAGSQQVREILKKNPDKQVFLRRGFAFKGAGECKARDQHDIDKFIDWFAACDIEVTDTEIHLNGFSVYDLE